MAIFKAGERVRAIGSVEHEAYHDGRYPIWPPIQVFTVVEARMFSSVLSRPLLGGLGEFVGEYSNDGLVSVSEVPAMIERLRKSAGDRRSRA